MYTEVENDIHQQYFPEANEVLFEEMRVVLTLREFHDAYGCCKALPHWILMGVDERFKISVWQFHLVDNLDAFDAFPWGGHVHRHSTYSFKHTLDGRRDRFERRQLEKGAHVHMVETYNIYSLSHALLVIPDLGIQFSTQRDTDMSLRTLKWS
ncbi:hypothetical protein Ddye_030430 [Dipteronia dyeriana]|uniref:Uncharacterized protein n=1 Tax=Dipteronia dyeriana TaxID=168575 RepID=A0AAD9TGX3_9ROSI|nr:hypothetical protein Ddye_030430 [Dipteronia dyeriana]